MIKLLLMIPIGVVVGLLVNFILVQIQVAKNSHLTKDD